MTVHVATDSDIDTVRRLWREYWDTFGLPPDFQGFDAEVDSLPGMYAAPRGCLLLATVDGEAAGTAAYRPLWPGACEAKRMFVRPLYRGFGVARALLHRLTVEARQAGYREMYGDSLPAMTAALALYRSFGFEETEPYSASPTPGAVYLRLAL